MLNLTVPLRPFARPLPNAASIACITIGATFILAGILYLCCRRRRDFRGNRVEHDVESGSSTAAATEGVTEVGIGGKAVAVAKVVGGKTRRAGTQDERRWRREIRLELEAEVVDLRKKEKEDKLRADDFCAM